MQVIKKKGFSLVELMVVISIMAILMMAAIGSFSFYYKTFAQTRLTNLQKIIEYGVVKARSDGKTVIVCAATADSFDSDGRLDENSFSCSDTQSWGDNAIVAFESVNGDAIYQGEDDEIIGTLAKGHGGKIYISMSGSPSYLKISPNGFMATGNGNIVYCDRSNEYKAALKTNMVGRVVYTDSDTKGNGDAYTCG